MNVEFYCPLWGSEELPFETFCEKAKESGYDGAELSLPLNDTKKTDFMVNTLKQFDLKLLAQHWETIDPDIDTHRTNYRKRLEWLAAADPVFINSQTGRDWFNFEDNQRILQVAQEVSSETGVKIVHETHRGKFAFCAAKGREFAQANPELRLTADFSHWCAVSESLLEDQEDSLAVAISRADHIHARVGHPQGPQINEPRAPEWQDALNRHLGWWDQIFHARSHDGTETLTVAPEFGPWPYMPELPYTQQPVANQWDINLYIQKLLKDRWNQ